MADRPHILRVSIAALALLAGMAGAEVPLGPIGGACDPLEGTPYVRVNRLTASAPGALAGLRAGDMIYGAFGEPFGTTLSSYYGYSGALSDLGLAIERAESGDGRLPLQVLRGGTGGTNLVVQLPAAGSFGPAYPLGSPKYDALFQRACRDINSRFKSSGNQGYNAGFFGLILLSHTNWNSTTGSNDFGVGLGNAVAWVTNYLSTIILAPVEENDPAYVGPGLENWTVSSATMFLAEWIRKSGQTNLMPTLQRASDALANRIQDYQQPPYNGATGPTKPGLMGHGGVVGDYAHIGWTGLNIINAHAMAAMAMAKGAGAAVSDYKFQMSWSWVKSCTPSTGGDSGNVGYAWQQGGGDSAGRTAGVFYGMKNYGPGTNEAFLALMRDYIVRAYPRQQHAHAYTLGGVALYQFALPYLTDREQRYIMENWRYYYNLGRQPDGSVAYVGGRENNGGDGYLDLNNVGWVNAAMPMVPASGRVAGFPGPSAARIHAALRTPWSTWPELGARAVRLTNSTQVFDLQLTDAQGLDLTPGSYTAAWSFVSGPATATFSSATSATTSVTFPQGGLYRLQFTARRNSYVLTETYDVKALTAAAPPGYLTGQVQYELYTGLSGSTLSTLTNAAKYPASPDVVGTLSRLDHSTGEDNYGERITGFIIPPGSGTYRFYIASDDEGLFRFNPAGASAAGLTNFCNVPVWTSYGEWGKYTNQASVPVTLTAGQPYRFEALMKESGGGDHLQIAWTGPGITTQTVIGADFIAVQLGTNAAPVILQHPASATSGLGGSVTFNVRVAGVGPLLYQWKVNGAAYGEASSSSSLQIDNLAAGHAGDLVCLVANPYGVTTSATATLVITNVGSLATGGLWRDVYTGIGGSTIADLTNNATFPRFPGAGGLLTNAASPENYADNFGERWTGWLKPETSGVYRFLLASDDASELWLSPDQYPANKVRLCSVGGYTGSKDWSASAKSGYTNLDAGRRYYIEVRHKEGGGADHCALLWQLQGAALPTNGSDPLPGRLFECLSGGTFEDLVIPSVAITNPVLPSVNVPSGVGLVLNAFVFDDGLPNPPGATTTQWSQVSGPAPAVFARPDWTNTTVQFPTSGVYVLRLSAYDGAQSGFREVTAQVGAAPTTGTVSIAGYNIGSLATTPSYSLSNGTYRIAADGYESIYSGNAADDGFLLAVPVVGDCAVTAKITSVGTSKYATWTRAGVMIRESSAANARSAFMGLQNGGTRRFIYRTTAGANNAQSQTSGSTFPYWVKLVRTGTTVQAFTSANGSTWTQQGANQTISMTATVLVGLACASGDYAPSTNVISDFGVSGQILGTGGGGTNTANRGPVVSAGPDRIGPVVSPITLGGAAPDDGKPAVPGSVSVRWTQVSGPSVLGFSNTQAPTTTVTLGSTGIYTVRLFATDGEMTTFDDAALTATGNSVTVSIADPEAREGAADPAVFLLTRDGPTGSPLTVQFSLGGSATAGLDYTNVGSSAIIPAGTNAVLLSIASIDDSDYEGDETVTLTLTPNVAYGINPPGTATVEVIDDESYQPLLRWNGTSSSSSWDTSNPNWYAVREGLAGQRFSNGNHVVFEDVSGVSTVITLAASQSFQPGSLLVRTDRRYVFGSTGRLLGPMGLNKDGTGVLLLAVSNDFEGAVCISNGAVQVNLAAALGLGDVWVSTGGSLRVNGGIRLRSQTVRIAGTGPDGTGALSTSGSGEAAVPGQIILTAPAMIGSGISTLWISGGVNAVSHPLTVAGTGTVQVTNGFIAGSGGLIRRGTGTLALHGQQALSGGIVVEAGALQLHGGGWQINPFGQSNTVTVLTGAVLRTMGPNSFGTDQNHLIVKGGRVHLAAENYLTGMELFGGVITGGEVRCDGEFIRVRAAGSEAVIHSAVRLVGPTTFDVADSAAAHDLAIRGPVLYDQTLTKEGDGTLLIIAPGSHAGTIINDGRVQVGEGGTAGSLGSGPVTLQSELDYQLASTVTLHQAISGGGRLIQSGTGRLTLNGVQPFSGLLEIQRGVVGIPGWIAPLTTRVEYAGTLAGTGTIAGPVIAAGTVRSESGRLTIDQLRLEPSGRVEVVIGPGALCGLAINGTAQLTGSLSIATADQGPLPGGTIYTVLVAGAKSGSFQAVTLPAAGEGQTLTLVEEAQSLLLRVEEPVSIGIEAAVADASESGMAGRYRFTRTGRLQVPWIFQIGYGGTASNGLDTGLLPSVLSFAAGSGETSLMVHAVADAWSEGTEQLAAWIIASSNHVVLPPGTATIQIADLPIDAWRFNWFGTNANTAAAGDLEDSDGDGSPNLWEYAAGGNPASNGPAVLPFLSLSNGMPGLHFMRAPDAEGVSWHLLAGDEPGSGLTPWSEARMVTAAVHASAVEMRLEMPSNAPPRRVMGLQITRP